MKSIDQEKIFKTMIEFAHDGFLLLDSCGIIIQVNPEACSICGFKSADDIIQQTLKFTVLFDLYDFNGNIVPVEQSPVSRALNGEIITNFKGKGIKKDTGKVWFGLYSVIPMFDETKELVGVVLSIKDISDSIQLVKECEKEKEKCRSIIACTVEEKLQKSEAFLNRIIDQSPNPMWISDASGTLIKINQACLEMLNLSANEIEGKYNILKDDIIEKQGYMPFVKRACEKGDIGKFELVWKGPKSEHLAVKDYAFVVFDVNIFPVRNENGDITNVVIQYINITERKRMEESLRESERKAHAIFDISFGFLGLLTPEGILLDANRTALEFVSVRLSDVKGKLFWETPWWSHSPQAQEQIKEAIKEAAQGILVRMETIHKAKDNTLHFVDFSLKPMLNEKHQVALLIAEGRDITERKQAEIKLTEHTRFVESIISMTPDILYIYDIIDSVNVYVNKGIEKILGYSEEEIKSMRNRIIPALMHPDDLAEYRRIIIPKYRHAKDNEPIIHEYRMRHKTGEWRWLASNETVYLRQSDGSPRQIFGLVHDITERKNAQEALQESEYFFKESQRAANIGSYKLDFTTGCFKSSEVFDRIFGIDPNYNRSVQGWLDIVHPDDRAMMNEYQKEIENSKSHPFNKEYRIIRKSDGIVRWVDELGRIISDSKGSLISMLGTIQDITERKEAQEKLQEERNKLSNITATLPGVICSFRLNPDGSSQMPYSSPAMLDASGFTSEEMAKDMSMLFTLIHPDDAESFNKSLAQSMLNMSPWRKEFRYKHPRKGEVWIETHAMPQREAGGSTIWQGFVTDVTERKRAEEALRQSEEKFSKAFMSSPDSITISQISDGVFIEINNGSMEIFGYTREEMIGHSSLPGDLGIWVNKEDRDRMVTTLFATGEVNAFESLFRRKDGSILNAILSARIIKMNGKDYLLTTIHDITERKHAEEARNRLTRELRALSSCNQAVIRAENEQTLLNDICRIICEVAGYRMTWVGFIVNGGLPNMRVIAAAGFGASVMTDETFTLTGEEKTPIDTAIRHKVSCITPDFTNAPTGTLWSNYALKNGCHSAIALPILDEAGNSLGVLSIYSGEPDVFAAEEIKLLEELAGDLSFGIMSLRTRVERRLAQRGLIYEKKLSDALIEASPGIFLVTDRTGRILRMNTNFVKLQGLTREIITSQDPLKFVYRDDYELSKRDIERMPEVGHVEADIRYEFMPGEISWWRMSGHAVTIAGTVYLIVSGSDITSRKHMEENLQIAIKDKEVLLQELYHRTKNNMQVISAYLSMQVLALGDERLQTIINEMENRIRAMALVHEKLYESKDLTNINLREYLSDLNKLIFNSFPGASDKITLIFEVEEISVTMDIAIPIGLVVTELLTNSLKYAFPEGRSGKILLRMQKHDQGQLELVISDNGVGVPGTFDFTQKDSIGIPTVLSIVRKQLRGSVELDTAKGFNWKIILRSDLYSKRV